MENRMETVSLKNVKITDTFLKQYLDNMQKTLTYQWNVLNDRIPGAPKSHCMENFRIAAGLSQGEFSGEVFQDSDLAKWLEAVAYYLEYTDDLEMEHNADEAIDIIGNAQWDDGYINTYVTIHDPRWRFTNLREGHELYSAGHLIEAAVAYARATGKQKILKIAEGLADCICHLIGPGGGQRKGYPGHPEIELALIKLYDATKNKAYLDEARYFIDERGREPYYFNLEREERPQNRKFIYPELEEFDRRYFVAHARPRMQDTAEGHAVRATYLYSSMADLAGIDDDSELQKTCRAIWKDIVTQKMYITGGIGSAARGERFTTAYDLPNDTAYAESCASIGLIGFAMRMFRNERKSEYIDVAERALYNTVLAGISLSGDAYFYVNPLEIIPGQCENNPMKAHVKPVRQKWFGVACCPPNIMRTLASVGSLIYAQSGGELYVNLFLSNESELEIEGTKVSVVIHSSYPFDGTITLSVTPEKPVNFALHLRIPEFCRQFQLSVDGKSEYAAREGNGYVSIDRRWDGNTVQLQLIMPATLVEANPKVSHDCGRAAIQKGPLVYCLEECDSGKGLAALRIKRDVALHEQFEPELLGGTLTISCDAEKLSERGWKGKLYRTEPSEYEKTKVKAVPYCLWGNREHGEMLVFLRLE